MAAGDLFPVLFGPPFPGSDTTRNPIALGPQVSASSVNVDGDGLKIAKRWGIAKEVATAMSGPIYDLAFVHPTAGLFSSFFAVALYKGASNAISRGVYRPGADFTNGGAIPGVTDSSMIGTLHPGSNDVVLISGPASYTTNGRYFKSSGVTSVAVANYLGPDGLLNARFDVMGRHKLCMFTARYNNASRSMRLQYCDPDAPLVWPPQNFVDADNLGKYPSIEGFKSAGDVAYAGGSHGVYGITGATPVTFKMHPTDADFGFAGSRSCDSLKGILYGIATRLGNDTQVPFDLFVASGLSTVRIGEPVRSAVLNTNGGAYTDARTRAWPWRDAILFMPRRAGATAAARTVIYYHAPSKTFWPYTIPSAISPNCFEADAGNMWMGCVDGIIRYFKEDAADDDGTAFSSSWMSGPAIHPEGRLMRLKKLIVWGKNTSGLGTVAFTITQDGTAMSSPKTATLPTTATNVPVVLYYPDDTTFSYVTHVTPTFPATGYQVEITRLLGIFEIGEYIQ